MSADMKLEASDSHKALVFLFIQSGQQLPQHWAEKESDRQIKALAFLCFDGDFDRAKTALVANEILGFANQQNHGS